MSDYSENQRHVMALVTALSAIDESPVHRLSALMCKTQQRRTLVGALSVAEFCRLVQEVVDDETDQRHHARRCG